MPSENTEKFDNAPPVNRSSMVMDTPESWNEFANSLNGMPGTGTYAPKRYSARIARVNKIFLRSSGTLNASMIELSKALRPFLRLLRSSPWRKQTPYPPAR